MSAIGTGGIADSRVQDICRAIGWIGLGLVAVTVSLSDLLAAAPADATGIGPLLSPPSTAFQLGTDILGRDMLSETLHGLTATVRTALPASIIALSFGALAGFSAARMPAPLAFGLRWLADIFAALPTLLLAVLIVGLTARSWLGVAAGLAATPYGFVHAFDRARRDAYAAHAEYARATGLSRTALLRRDLVYEFRAVLSASAARALASVTIILSTLSFFGFGAEPPQRDLGLMIAASRPYFLHAWWTAAYPALALMTFILFARLAAGLEESEPP